MENPETLLEYRKLLRRAFISADAFRGTERQSRDLLSNLILMEEFLRAHGDGAVNNDLEERFAREASISGIHSIDELLGHASSRAWGVASTAETFEQRLAALVDSGVLLTEGDTVFIPADEGSALEVEADTGATAFEIQQEPRLAGVIQFLQSQGIYTDDIILRVGGVAPNAMRKSPYVIVEIPRLGAQIGVCDQKGQALFVSSEIMKPAVWAETTKSQLKEMPNIACVHYNSRWRGHVLEFLHNRGNTLPDAKIAITDEMRDMLKAERVRTRVGAGHLLQALDAPARITEGMIRSWQVGTSTTASKQHWDWVIGTLRGLPDAQLSITITNAMHDALKAEMVRTRVGPKKLLQSPNAPDGLHYVIVKNWAAGMSKTASGSHWNWVMSVYASLPDSTPFIEISEEMAAQLASEIARVQISTEKLLQASNAPDGLAASVIRGWRNHPGRSAKKADWDWAISTLRGFPDAAVSFVITNEMRDMLNTEMMRTQVGAKRLLQAPGAPEGLKVGTISGWQRSPGRPTEKAHWDWVIGTLRELPASVFITDEMRALLNGEATRTQVGTINLLKTPDAPEGLTINAIQSWRNGIAKSARKSHWDWAIARYSTLPDGPGYKADAPQRATDESIAAPAPEFE